MESFIICSNAPIKSADNTCRNGVGKTEWIPNGYYGFSYPGMEEMAGKFNLPSRIYPQVSFIGLLFGPMVILVSSVIASLYPAVRLRFMEPVAAMRAA